MKGTTTRHYIRVVAFVVLGISVGVLLMTHVYPRIEQKEVSETDQNPISNVLATTSLSRALPTLLEIPALTLSASFEAPLALNADNTVEVPDSFEKVGWYSLGASPGEIGPAVILGHVDSLEGPAVFYSLGKLKEGDEIRVTRADGSVATFVVEYFERYPQEEFPTMKVYGPTPDAELRLITCTGTFSKGKQRYSHNLVVYAKMITGTTTPSRE